MLNHMIVNTFDVDGIQLILKISFLCNILPMLSNFSGRMFSVFEEND